MRRSHIRSVAAAGLAAVAALSLPSAEANHVPVPPDHQATEKDFDPSHFSASSVNVTNKFLPIVPGTTFTLSGTANRGGGGNAHEVIFTATEVTKVVNGIRTQVLWDRDIQEGVLVEEELAFWAQDDLGNVWLFGEYPEEHAGPSVTAPSTWLAGVAESKAGVLMRVNPKVNTSNYEQGNAPSVEFLDLARVHAADQSTCGPTGCYEGVLVIDEWDPNQQPQDGHQFKFHAPGVGIVQVTARGGEEQETLLLTERRSLTSQELATANTRALELDRRAYTMQPEVYGGTEPALVRCPSAAGQPPAAPPANCVTAPAYPAPAGPPAPEPPA